MSEKKLETLNAILTDGVVAILRLDAPEKVMPMVNAAYKGGIRAIEITMNTPGALKLVEEMSSIEDIIPGAGTVTNARMAEEAIKAGAQYIVTPVTKKEVIEVAKKHDKPIFSGAFSPGEIFQAHEWGADVIKLFPASTLGLGYINYIHGPFPEIKLMPTGGVNINNVGQWLAAGASCVAVGGTFFSQELVEKEDWEGLTLKTNQFMAIIRHFRQ